MLEAGFFESESFDCVIIRVPVKDKSFYKVEMQKNQPKNTTFHILAHRLRHFCRFHVNMAATIMVLSGTIAQAEPLVMEPFTQQLPDIEILDKTGAPIGLSDFDDMPLIVNFWATWCAPCIHELPALDRAAEALSGEARLLLVSVDRGGAAKAAGFLEERGIDTPHTAYDPKSLWARALGLRGLPSTLVITENQTEVWLISGPAEWDTDEVLSQLRAQLAEAK